MKKLLTALAFVVTAATSYAQTTTTSSGWGIAGNGIGSSAPAGDTTTNHYNIDIATQDRFDGDKHPLVYLVINNKLYLMSPPSATAVCMVMKRDAVKGKWVQFGSVYPKNSDGSQFAGGAIFVNEQLTKVITFKQIAFYTPKTPVTVKVQSQIIVYRYQPICACYIHDPALDIGTTFVGGAIWVNHDATSILSAILDGPGTTLTIDFTPVPAPGGLGSPVEPLMAFKME